MVGAPDVVQPWMPRAVRDSDACFWHVSLAGDARCRGCAAAGVPESFNGLLGQVGSVSDGRRRPEGGARRRLLRALQGAPARRLLVLLLPGGQPPRRRGPDRADVPAGLPALRAGA